MSESTAFIRLLVGLLLTATGVHASCPLELSPPSVVVRYGDSVSINCTTSETAIQGMGWEASKGGTGLEHVTHLNWTVANLTAWDTSILCFVNLLDGSQCTKNPTVVLYTFPETIRIKSSSGPHGVMHEGRIYNFTCDIYNIAPVGNLTVRWFKGDAMVKEKTFDNTSKKPVNISPVFSFTPTRQDNGVSLRCEAHLDLLPEGPRLNASSQEFNITVNFGPDTDCFLEYELGLKEGATLESGCHVKGRPTPNVSWMKDDRPFDPTVPLSRADAGWYHIKAEGATIIEKKLFVPVMYGPELNCPSLYTAVENVPHNFSCTVGGYPQPKIIWYKDGEEVVLPNNLTRGDSGQYLITATSNVSSDNLTVNITVKYPPSQIVELEDSEVDVGSTVWLKCHSTGNPRPQYSWDYYETTNVMVENEDGVSRLHIQNATAYNTGSYTCHASNNRGNVSKTVRVTVKGARPECPIKITPDRMVVQYQERGQQQATCKPTSADSTHVTEIYWEVQGERTNSKIWFADTDKDWDPQPVCNVTFNVIGPCQKHLDFTLYKKPDSVSIRHVDALSSVVEEGEFQLQCDITSVAPARNVTVHWYRGDETLEPLSKGSLQVTGCLSDNDTDCDPSVVRSPLNVSSTISITLNRRDNGTEFRCEAQLNLGPGGPQPAPSMTSSPLNISVYYKPVINTTKLPKEIPVFSGYPEVLVCEADGHPPPKIKWFYSLDKEPHLSGNTLTVSEAGVYNCSATNEVASVYYEVKVILKEDYLPLIAGFVAVTVVAISVVFIFFYSIYYKNTKMRRYSLKNAKLDTHNSNVAHNGWDMQFPMTKLHTNRKRSTSGLSQEVEQEVRVDAELEKSLLAGLCFVIPTSVIQVFSYWQPVEIMRWFFILTGVIAFTGKPVDSSCPVQLSPPRVVVRFGDSLSINCSSTSDQIVFMGLESMYGSTKSENDSFVVLEIASVRHWDLEPICYINQKHVEQCLVTLPVTVYKTPDSVSISQPSVPGPMLEGQKYRMQCDIANVAPVRNVSVHWYKGDKLVHTERLDGSSQSPVNTTSVFNLTAQRGDDQTQIWCKAQLNFWGTVPKVPSVKSESHDLIVLYSPTFLEPKNETIELSAGSKLILRCDAKGNPTPGYSWDCAHPIQQTAALNETQSILAPSIELSGTYKCTASNSQGSKTKYFTVTEAKRNRTTLAALVGGFAFLGVALMVAGLFFVTPDGTFSFSKGGYLMGRPVSSGPSAGMKGALLFQHSSLQSCQACSSWDSLSLSLLHRRLSAENNMGNNFLKWSLTLCMFYSVSGEGCSLILKPSRVVVGFGEPVSVSCEAARPVRVLGWESAISAAHTQQELSVQWKVDSLIDWIEEPICYGVFFTAPRQCEEKLNLVLYKTPDSVSIRPVNHSGPMVAGKEYQLLCEVQNIAPVQYLTLRWYKGQTEVYNHSFSDLTSSSPVQVSSVLMVTPTKAENGAQYRCVAELELGPEGPRPPPSVTSEPLNASVYFPPTFLSPDPEVLDLVVGAEMTLDCTATGNPTPVYSWQSSHPTEERMEDEAALTSASLLPGTYICTASNTLEKKSKQFIVKAKTKGV
ncbi:hemicentin-1-like [Anoplopoma fimbria]|uniref:hemicentin-1-like n=1 Tax=Anoplopoma fimbria TaxID=229290 RepID=UPI0023EB2CA9|nr:hemicentin-1-like [Anoplopoma fimbria]